MIARIIALLLIILLSPLLILISITIFVEDGFPIIYKQVNLGKNHKTFILFKFRTMLKNTPLLPTEEMNDSNKYLLKSGHFLRKYSLDELPQFFNVLNGTMNFIGPRPCLEKNEEIIKNLREELEIHKIKPGITGLAQVSGRDSNSYHKKVEFDHYYYKNRSFKMQIKIILKTFLVILLPKDIKH
tara:strand:- start:4214 stop:4768 length:555 start_codon:yes stop_codon:yes gene_type:complete